MTGTPFNDDLDGAELMLRERFETAVGALTPDIGRLVAGGTAEGHGAVRRRRILTGVAAAVVAVIAVGSVSYASQSDLFGMNDDHATDQDQLVPLVPATPRGLAAAVMAHTKDLGSPITVGGASSELVPGSADWELFAQIAYTLDDGAGLQLEAFAGPDVSQWRQMSCAGDPSETDFRVCRPFTLADGTPALYLEYAGSPVWTSNRAARSAVSGRDVSAAAAVAIKRDDQLVTVVETVVGTADFPLTQDDLTTIAADPSVGLSTTAALNALGEDIPDFRDGGLVTGDSGSGSGSATSTAPAPETAHAPQPSGGSGDASSGQSR